MKKRYVAYYRVSTAKQGKSGLGLEAQRKEVTQFVKSDLVQEFVDVESGKNDKRTELIKALEFCKKEKATLIISKLDRLSRNVAFIATLMDSKVDFICCDMPEATPFTLHIFSALAQQEREFISERTKKALAVLKDRGVKLGNPQNLTDKGRAEGRKIRTEKAKTNENKSKARNYASMLKDQGHTLQEIADRLNKEGFKTSRGNEYFSIQVSRLIQESIKYGEKTVSKGKKKTLKASK